ncbi:MAG: tetratricopeptide repeat protein, partial [Gammaproteobacteria bacterium]|nr:tetratricopeptide repeat protein [Gammaproteobacteria bacterium]
MLLHRFTNRDLTMLRLMPMALALFVTGCASTGPGGESTGNEKLQEASAPASVAADAATIAVPPQAKTLYEQATAVMASGDFVDAELRLKEFLLLYPQFPGAYVNLAIIHADSGDDEKARTAIDSALTLAPDYAPA